MAMNFWEAQRKAKIKTVLYLTIFILLTIIAATLAEYGMRIFSEPDYAPQIPYVGLGFLAVTFGVAGINYLNFLQQGGDYVAKAVGAKLLDPYSPNPKERQLRNIVEEIAIATSMPVPSIYILEANEINAFAAGTKPENSAITVTRGSLNLLNRDELQGVLAHEFAHIYNKDMTIAMRVAAMITGFFIVTYLGLRILEGAARLRHGEEDRRRANPIIVVALILLFIGAITWFFGSLLQAMVSRQREFLADASGVQYTRNPSGLANALRKISHFKISDMPYSGQPFAHLYFNEQFSFWARLFATHPPIEERIAAIEGRMYEAEIPPFPSSRHYPPRPPLL